MDSKILILMSVNALTLCGNASQAATCSGDSYIECFVGDTGSGGGVVFYKAPIRQTWGQYLEAAPATWYDGTTDPAATWCSNTTTYLPSALDGSRKTSTTSNALGQGWSNTERMFRDCIYGAGNIAWNYNGGGKTDWYLPSQAELQALFAQAAIVNLPQGFACYWSSTEAIKTSKGMSSAGATKSYQGDSPGDAWLRNLLTGESTSKKSSACQVRPIRHF